MRTVTREDPLPVENGLSVHERIDAEEWRLRRDIAKKIVSLFTAVNILVIVLIASIYVTETFFIVRGFLRHDEKIVNSQVIVAIVGATTIQLGAIAWTLSRWLFGRKVFRSNPSPALSMKISGQPIS
jgi:hypothetical protein